MRYLLKTRFLKGIVTRHINSKTSEKAEAIGHELKSLIHEKFGRSLFLREVDTGSCGACESEIISATNPIYDLQRFGINFVASPRHADILLVTGPVSLNMAIALKKTYEAMPEPKFVVTIGDCALHGGVFKDSYYTHGAVSPIVPVNAHIPGCPPTPLEILQGLLDLLKG